MANSDLKLDQSAFLKQYSFSATQFKATKLDWQMLERVCSLHTDDLPQLETTAGYISQRLREVPVVHSLKVRIKHPEHLIEKIIRKRLENSEFAIGPDNYKEAITDLIGIRALHLFKGDWQPIHQFVTDTWELVEVPIAYVRQGDSEKVLKSFRECGCKVEPHSFGYRSVHYLVKSQPARSLHLAELQVRTLFEEGWSEIDHQVRYPRLSDNPHLAEFLTIFNRLSGSADEMGTFIKTLSRHLAEQGSKLARAESQLEDRENDLRAAISALSISKKEKENLEAQVAGLRKSSQPFASISPMNLGFDWSTFKTPTIPIVASGSTIWTPGIIAGGLVQRNCSQCGSMFTDNSFGIVHDRCPQCRDKLTIGPSPRRE